MNTTQFLLTRWTWNATNLFVGVALLLAYVAAFGIQRRMGWLAGAMGVFVLTLMSPLSTLADRYLFSAHMIQHILLLLAVPGFLLLSLPRSFSLAFRPRILGHPLVGWAAGVGSMWLWHAPTLCNAAVSSPLIHGVQTVSLVVLGIAFWRQILAPRDEERLPPPNAVFYLFSACLACSVLGIVITLSPVTICPAYSMVRPDPLLEMIRADWGFTPERDQQVGGLFMWVPMCLIYLGAIFAQLARWFAEPASPILRETQ